MYRAIHETFWTDPDLRAVGHEARNLFAFLITGPGAHMSGIYRLTFATMAEDYGVTVTEAKKLVDALIDAKFVSYDFDRSIIWIHNMYRHQPKGPNHKRSVEQQLTKLHGSHLAESFVEYYSEHNICYETVTKRLPNGCETFPKPERAKGEGKGKGIRDKGTHLTKSSVPAVVSDNSIIYDAYLTNRRTRLEKPDWKPSDAQAIQMRSNIKKLLKSYSVHELHDMVCNFFADESKSLVEKSWPWTFFMADPIRWSKIKSERSDDDWKV